MLNICLNALLRFVFLTFVFGYLGFYIAFIERYVYILHSVFMCKYFNMWKVWIPHYLFLIDKIFSVTFPIFFRIRIPIDSQLYMKYSYISENISKFYHGLIFGNLKGTHLKTSGLYQNIKVLLRSFRAIWESLFCLLPRLSSKGKEKINTGKRFCSKFVFTFSPFNYQVRNITGTKTLPNASTTNRIMSEHCISTRSQKVTTCTAQLRHQHQHYFHQIPGSYRVAGR